MSIAALIEAVEAGVATMRDFIDAFGRIPMGNDIEAYNAYHGSLNDAMALHEALLPGIMWARSPNGQFCLFDHNAEEVSYSFEKGRNHARAWLLAILRAKEAGQ